MDFECIWSYWRIIGLVTGVVGLIFSIFITGCSLYYGPLLALVDRDDREIIYIIPIFCK